VLVLGIIFAWSFLVSVFAIPSIISVSHHKRLLDEPGERRVHSQNTPRLGGLAIFAGFFTAIMIFGGLNDGIQHLLAGCFILFFVGVKDDIVSVSAFKKFFIQLLAAGIVMFMGDVRITSFQGIFGINELDYGISYGFTFLVIIGITNAINLIDGLDGLAGSIIFLASATFAIVFFQNNNMEWAIVSTALVGAILGFLRYNAYKAKIFMGDTGSLISGFIVAVLSIKFVEYRSMEVSPSATIAILIIPIFDTIRVFSLRIISGLSPFVPDKNHIHHVLLRMGLSNTDTLLYLMISNLTMVILVFLFQSFGNLVLISFMLTTGLAIGIYIEYSLRFKKNLPQDA
jgi:UDP-GlcNAc:undecaprenyl-phosphate/decaprenyl-phosphate GlcNAc-1-phosphate transferase